MIQDFLTYLNSERRVSQHTSKAYENDVNSFLQYSSVENENGLNEISYQNVRGWIVELINHGTSNRSVNRKLSSLRTFFKWALKMNLIEVNPMMKIKGPKQEKRLPEFVKEEEMEYEKIEELFPDGFTGLRDRLMIEIFYQTGIRLSELIELKYNNVFNDRIKVLGKRNKERIIPITPVLSRDIQNYLSHPVRKASKIDFVFITDRGNKLYPKFVYRKVKYYLSLITNLSKRSPHVLRHTFATHMLNNGSGLETLKEVLGHEDLSATQVYTHNSFDQISKIYKQSHPRGGDSD